MYEYILQDTAHRPAPLPAGPWLMTQRWEHVLFMHWPVPVQVLRKHIPPSLEIDIFEGKAWIGIVAFKVSDLKMRFLPRIPFLNRMQEVNVRTYVKCGEKHGTYFFSLDASKTAAVLGGNLLALPYKKAKMKFKEEKQIRFYSRRQGNTAVFQSEYQPLSNVYTAAKPGTLTNWMIERYRLWTVRGNALYQGDIHHQMWRLSSAKAKVEARTLTYFLPDLQFNNRPLLHYSPSQRALIWPLKKVSKPF